MLSQLSSAEPPSSPPKVRLRVGVLLVLAHVALQFLRELRARIIKKAGAERGLGRERAIGALQEGGLGINFPQLFMTEFIPAAVLLKF